MVELPALIPLTALGSVFLPEEYHFQYESVLGTSLDLLVWTPHSRMAEGACHAVLKEIDRLALILNTRHPESEISRLHNIKDRQGVSRELGEVLDAYSYWERWTNGVFSLRPGGADAPISVDALGKAYIIDEAAKAARKAWPSIDALLLNIGGDIVVWGRSFDIAIADPGSPYDNAQPIGIVNRLVRAMALWANKSKYYATLGTIWNLQHGNLNRFRSVTRATRSSGRYELV
jgi:thiamine biosynthesis lipoprotein